MARSLDIGPLRSFVAVADAGGFQRAADVLHMSQGAVSGHVRRLEGAVGKPLIERRPGRGWRFTVEGERFLHHARRILALHDEALLRFSDDAVETLVIGSTEHAATQLLPHLRQALDQSLPDHRIRFRIDRGTRLREAFSAGRLDIALLLGPASDPRATPVGELELTWYSAPGWMPPGESETMEVVAFDGPCALRDRALETLAQHAIPVTIAAEALQLAGVQAAVRAGLGVALMATLGQAPEGLVAVRDLPSPEPIPLAVWASQVLEPTVRTKVADAVSQVIVTAPRRTSVPVIS